MKDPLYFHKADFYKEYKEYKKSQGHKVKDIIPQSTYYAIIDRFLYLLMKKIVSKFFMFNMPYGLGSLYIREFKPARSIKGVVAFAMKSWDTTYRITWDKTRSHFRNREIRLFKPSDVFNNIKKHEILERSNLPHKREYLAHMAKYKQERISSLRYNYKSAKRK